MPSFERAVSVCETAMDPYAAGTEVDLRRLSLNHHDKNVYSSYQGFYGNRTNRKQQQQNSFKKRSSSSGEGSSSGCSAGSAESSAASSSAASDCTTSAASYEDGGSGGSDEIPPAEHEDLIRTQLHQQQSPLLTDDDDIQAGPVTDLERMQIESFFKGLQTQVYVCGTLANLYLKSPSDNDWQLKYTGIPVIVLDAGHCKARAKRRIQIALAERGTSFMLWRDTIDNLSSYRVAGKAFHTMCYSGDHSIQVGFSFDTAQDAHGLWTHIEQLISCPENICLSSPDKKKRKKKEKKSVYKPPIIPTKSHISQPCCFQHITSVDREDSERYYSLKELVVVPNTVENYVEHL